MNKKLTPRYIIIAIILAWAIYSLWPSISFQQMTEVKKETLREKVRLVHNHFIDDVRYIIQTWINTEPSQAQKILPKSLEKGYLRRTV